MGMFVTLSNNCCCTLKTESKSSVCWKKKKKSFFQASYHVWTLFEPCQCERRVPGPFAVQGDIGVDVDRFRLRLHQQDGTDWRRRNRHKGVVHPSDSRPQWKEVGLEWDERQVTHSERPPGCWRWSSPRHWKPDRRRARWKRSGRLWWWTRSPGHPVAPRPL